MTEKSRGATIRPATALDAVNIVRLLQDGWKGSGAVQVARVNETKAMEYVLSTIKLSEREDAFVSVADLSGRLVGTLACVRRQERWSEDWFLGKEWFYVTPTWLTRGTAHSLLAEAEKHADARAMSMLFEIDIATQSEFDRLLANRPGYRRHGATYLRMPEVTGDVDFRIAEDHHHTEDSELA